MKAFHCDSVQNFISACCDWFEYCEDGLSFRFICDGNECSFVIRDVEFADLLTYPLDDYSDKAFRKVLSFLMPHFRYEGNTFSLVLSEHDQVILYLSSDLYHHFLNLLANG